MNGLRDLKRTIELGRVDGNEDGIHMTGDPSSAAGASVGIAARRLRSIASIRRRCDQIRVRISDQVGTKPIRKATSSRIGSLMSAWMSPHRLTVTSNQLRVEK